MMRTLVVVAVFVAVNASGFVVYREVHATEPAMPPIAPAKTATPTPPAPAKSPSPPPPAPAPPAIATESLPTTTPDPIVASPTETRPAAAPAATVRPATVRPHTNDSAIRTQPKKAAAAITKSIDEAPAAKPVEPVKSPAPEKDKVLEMEGNPYKRGE